MGYPKGKMRRPDVSTETLIELYKQHKKTQVVADLVGMSRAGVWSRLMSVGQVSRQRIGHGCAHRPDVSTKQIVHLYVEEGLSAAEIAERFGMTSKAIWYRLHMAKVQMRRHVWTAEEDAIIRLEYRQHAVAGTVRLLADRLGRNKNNLTSRARTLGLTDPANKAAALKAWHARGRKSRTITRREEHVCIA